MEIDIRDKTSFFKAQVQESLRTVLDPELDVNIIDLGLVYGIDVNEETKTITVTMTLSSQYCPMGDAILQSVENCLEHFYPAYIPKVELTWEPRWSYESLTEEGLRQLGRR
ncbi:metal-sulfur cluster assembly factor [Desertivirga arenae]|uniref:metal-sulfur cluster assembly factor n=1 Tax=Desertivirga arenae TaxID=2810309 RepID=UPI001A969661|nr:metal-sulfur cluster assembly factor [Pedobacter sp. SYSU D00823]